jgi:tripartite-type tricarboxylate transporter receptor subunit TctC
MRKKCNLILTLAIVAILVPTIFAPALSAADYPTKPIKLIVPWGAGGNADTQARILAKISEKTLGQPIAVTNKPGGATIPGVTEALQARPDGYTLIWIAIPSVATQPFLRKTPYTLNDLFPLANVSQNTLVLYVREDSDWFTLMQFVESAKTKPVNMSLNAIGALPHLAAVELAQKTKAKFNYVTAKSSAGAVVSLLGGHVDAALGHEPQAFSHGKGLRALAVFEPDRSSYLPLVPTAKELGYDVVGYVRDAVAINIKAPQNVKNFLADVFKKAMESDEFKNEFLKRRIKEYYLNPANTIKLWESAADTYSKIIEGLQK